MKKTIDAAIEFNKEGAMLHLTDYPGAFTRGPTKDICLSKVHDEVNGYLQWKNNTAQQYDLHFTEINIIQETYSRLQISDADTDIIFFKELQPISKAEYLQLKSLVLKSAYDFDALYHSIPDKSFGISKPRKTFYGEVPSTPKAMYRHTNEVTKFYLNGLKLNIELSGHIFTDRLSAFKVIEQHMELLNNKPFSVKNEVWTLSKALRRFLWHDRIHAKAMYRLASKKWKEEIANTFCFTIER